MCYLLRRRVVSLGTVLSLTVCVQAARAQIATDGSLGAAMTLNGPNYQIPSQLGQIKGHNLFHSFQDFNLSAGEAANFSGPGSIANILARVTGGNFSSIDGSINSSIAGANLYFINPSGISFGPNAHINVGGSFVATTADLVHLKDGGVFNAINPLATSITSAPVSSFGFLSPQPAPIFLTGTGLTVASGKAISLLAGGLGLQFATLTAPQGKINLVSVGSAGQVALNGSDPTSTPTLQGFSQLGLIGMDTSFASVAAMGPGSSGTGGSIDLRGDSLFMNNSSLLSLNDGATSGGGIGVDLTGDSLLTNGSNMLAVNQGVGAGPDINFHSRNLTLKNESYLNTSTYAEGEGGNLNVSTRELQVTTGAQIQASSFGSGNGGSISVIADNALIDGVGPNLGSSIASSTEGEGVGGNIDAQIGSLTVSNGAGIVSETYGSSKGGDIRLKADDITVQNGSTFLPTAILSQSYTSGQGGDIAIDTKSLEVLSGARILSNTLVSGDGGKIAIAADQIAIDGSGSNIFDVTGIQAQSRQKGQGGAIAVDAKNLQVLNGGEISSDNHGVGNGGNVIINADQVAIDGGRDANLAFVQAQSLAAGQSGTVEINAKELQVLHGAQLRTVSRGSGNGGNLTINADQIKLDGRSGLNPTGIFANTVGTGGGGNAGDLNIVSKNVQVGRGSQIDGSTFGDGNGSSVTIEADDITLDKQGSSKFTGIASSSTAVNGGRSGSVHIKARNLNVLGGAAVDVTTTGRGNGGNIEVNAVNVLLDGKNTPNIDGIYAQTKLVDGGGKSGNISLNSQNLKVVGGAQISASTNGSGNGGSVAIKADNITLGSASDTQSSIINADNSDNTNAGKAGNISIETKNLQILHGAIISTGVFGGGNQGVAGNFAKIKIDANNVMIDGQGSANVTGVFAQFLSPTQPGQGGDINLTAKELHVLNGGLISATTNGKGNSGDVKVSADRITLDGQTNLGQTGIGARTLSSGNGGNGGDILVNAKELSILSGASIGADTSGSGAGGTVTVKSDAITLDGLDSSISAITEGIVNGDTTNGEINKGGDVNVTSKNLQITNGAQLAATTFGSGKGGNVSIKGGNITVKDGGFISAGSDDAATGKGGNIDLIAKNLQVLNGSDVSSATRGSGDGGTVTVTADNVTLDGQANAAFTGIGAQTQATTNGGKGGDIILNAKELQILNGGSLSATTIGSGTGGTIHVTANDITLDGQDNPTQTGISAQTQLDTPAGKTAKGGDVTIKAKNLTIRRNGGISASTFGTGDGGSLNVNADHILLDQATSTDFTTGISAQTNLQIDGGQGGDINVTTKNLEVVGGTQISASTLGSGNGGSVSISADQIDINQNGSILAQSQPKPIAAAAHNGGNGGDINIQTNTLQVSTGGQIAANSLAGGGTGGSVTINATDRVTINDRGSITAAAADSNGGNVKITASDSIDVDNNSEISSNAGKDGGNIELRAARLIHLRNSILNAVATGNGGNITIDPKFVIFDNSQVKADAVNGNGGNISITAQVFIPSSDSKITADSQNGLAGTILIDAPNPNIGSSLVRLSARPLSAEDSLEERCLLRRGKTSSFIVGRLGLAAPDPYGLTPSLGTK